MPGFGRKGHALDHFLQALARIGAVLFQTARLLRLDNHYAFFADALIVQRQKTQFDRFGQRGFGDIKAQMHCVGDLVDVLPARTLRANRSQFDLLIAQGKGQHHGDQA